jgi:hypothetical protein
MNISFRIIFEIFFIMINVQLVRVVLWKTCTRRVWELMLYRTCEKRGQ